MHSSVCLWRSCLLPRKLNSWLLICIFLFSSTVRSEAFRSPQATCVRNLTADSGYWYYMYNYIDGGSIHLQKCTFTLEPSGELAKKENLILTFNFLYYYSAIPSDHIQFPTGNIVSNAEVPNFAQPNPTPDCYHIVRGSSCKSVIANRFCSPKKVYNFPEKEDFVFNVQSYIMSFTIQYAFFACDGDALQNSTTTTTEKTARFVQEGQTAYQGATTITTIVFGCLLAIIIIILMVYLLYKRCIKRRKNIDVTTTSWEGNSVYQTTPATISNNDQQTTMNHQQQRNVEVQDFPTRTPPLPRPKHHASLPTPQPRKVTLTKPPPYGPRKLPSETDAPYLSPLVSNDEDQTIYAEIPAQNGTTEEQPCIAPAKKKSTITKPPRSKMNRAPSAYCEINVRKA